MTRQETHPRHSERKGIDANRSSVPRVLRLRSATLRMTAWKSAEIMNGSTTALPRRLFGQTMRADVWWIHPLLVFIGLSTFIVYSTWAAFQGQNYFLGNYISPFYSPELFGGSPHSWFGPKTGLVAAVASIFAGSFSSLGTGWFPAHLLLLSWRLLQSVLGRSAGMHGWRTTQKLLG